LYHTVEASRPGVHFSSDTRVPGSGRMGKKNDVYQMVSSLCISTLVTKSTIVQEK